MSDKPERIYCNARKNGYAKNGRVPLREPGPHGGEGYCKQVAGMGTEHLGQGRCKYHGGMSPIQHGRYSKVQREDLSELVAHFEGEDEPLDVRPELDMIRALLTRYINKYDEILDALVAWNAGEQDRKPQRLPELHEAVRFLKSAAKIAQDEKKLMVQNAISRKDLSRVLQQMAHAVEAEVNDPETIRRIKDAWSSIQLA